MRSRNDRDSSTLNRREMIATSLALGLTGRSFAGQALKPSPPKSDAHESIQNPAVDVRKEGLATVKGPSDLLNKKLEEISICGPTRACGRAYGRVFADYIYGWMNVETKPSDERLKKAADCLPYIEKYAPNSFEFLQGAAEGAGFSLEHMALAARWEEVLHDLDVANAQQQSSEHCTAFVSSRTRSTDRRTIVAQNWDFYPQHFAWGSLLRLQCDGLPATLTLNYPGLWSSCGINAEGLALMWTSTGMHPPTVTVPGVPAYVLISELLTMASVGQAVAFLEETPHAGSFNFLLADAAGRTAVIEARPGKLAVDYAPVNCRANHFEMPQLVEAHHQDLDTPSAASSKRRAERAHDVLRACDGQPSLDIIKAALTEKPIFREESFHSATVDSLVACCEERALWHCRGGLEPGQWFKTVL